MSIVWKELVAGVTLTGAPASYYSAPFITSAAINAASVYNPTGAPVVVNIYKVPVGMVADASTLICSRTVLAGAVATANEAINHKLQPGTRLFALGLGLTLNISGVEYVPE